MTKINFLPILTVLCLTAFEIAALDRYVSPYGANNPPYANWADAATNIQWAVDAAASGETVWVTNGTYYLTNEISVTKSNLTIRSVNGRDLTIVDGNNYAGKPVTNRCIRFWDAGAGGVLDGFTVSNGYSITVQGGGGVYCSLSNQIRNCRIVLNGASGTGGEGIYMGGGMIANCEIANNSGSAAGGIYLIGGLAQNCQIASNSSCGLYSGAGSTTIYCTIIGNTNGGADCSGVIQNCTVKNNKGTYAGIFLRSGGIVLNCLITENVGDGSGGVYFNSGGTLENCTVVSNYSIPFNTVGGVNINTRGTLRNCISYGNMVGGGSRSNYYRSAAGSATDTFWINSCALPEMAYTNVTVINSIYTNPAFVSFSGKNFRLARGSPCINAGTNQDWMTNAVDLDGATRIWNSVVDIGCFEYWVPNGTIITVP